MDFMSTDHIDDKLDKLNAKIDALKKQKRRLKAAANKKQKQRETRRKILLGSFLLNDMQKNQKILAYVKRELPDFLTRDVDKALFDDDWWELLEMDDDEDDSADSWEQSAFTSQNGHVHMPCV